MTKERGKLAKHGRGLERGDFQTPASLCEQVAAVLVQRSATPRSIIEPTCGQGNLLFATLSAFGEAQGLGVEIDAQKCTLARQQLAANPAMQGRCEIRSGDFYQVDWCTELARHRAPRLVVGNPPWVTNSELGSAGIARNLPRKSVAGSGVSLSGIEARMGASNFDVSEWMVMELIAALPEVGDSVAMLLKSSVARRVLMRQWRQRSSGRATLYDFDARRVFGASVDAVLLVWTRCLEFSAHAERRVLSAPEQLVSCIGERNDSLIADVDSYDRYRRCLASTTPERRWRSGVKHDCAAVFELHGDGTTFRDAHGEEVCLEAEWLYPLCKGTTLARGEAIGQRWVLVTQRRVGEETASLQSRAPGVWRYLSAHEERLAARRSSIYRGKPAFSMFGVGEYSFALWKVAISSLHKALRFRVVGPHEGCPVLFDDTVYFLPCDNEAQAHAVVNVLHGEEAQGFLASQIFWDAKRPVTTKLLHRFDLEGALSRADCT